MSLLYSSLSPTSFHSVFNPRCNFLSQIIWGVVRTGGVVKVDAHDDGDGWRLVAVALVVVVDAVVDVDVDDVDGSGVCLGQVWMIFLQD